ncbi:MAG: ATP-binding cassette domain-containing protein [Firmicutes bacterium]|nr:ATP-binding cassette domain-containing protein [Bacillota bacterium]
MAVRQVNVTLGGRKVLDNVDLDIKTGKTLVIMGLSGMGKSTMIRSILRLQEPESGMIFFEGQDILKLREHDLDEVRSRIGMVFQKAALFDSMTISENVGFGLKEQKKLKGPELEKRVLEMLDIVDLAGKENSLPSELSGGMQKRASLARVLCYRPEVILYDEPTTGLDPIICNVINKLIMDMKQRFGVTSVVVTHDLDSAKMIADEIAMLHMGKIIEKGTPEEFFNSSNPIVKQFVKGSSEGPIKV